MEANVGLVAGSHRRNELVRIRHDSDGGPKPLVHLSTQTWQICGVSVGLRATGDAFVAGNECAFPVFQACYEYERKDGTQCCPQCKTRYRRHKGSPPHVDGDDDEDNVDDLENEFNYAQGGSQVRQKWHSEEVELSSSSRHESQPIPLLTHGHTASDEIPCSTFDTQFVLAWEEAP